MTKRKIHYWVIPIEMLRAETSVWADFMKNNEASISNSPSKKPESN